MKTLLKSSRDHLISGKVRYGPRGGGIDYDYPNKSYWYSVDYEWSGNGRWKYCAFDRDIWLMMYDDGG